MSRFILFQDDWKNYPGAILHTSTPNRSAVELAQKLKLMGIKNNAFFLALLDPSLDGVDPMSENLTELEMVKIGIEINRNCWYYFREIARAPALAGTKADMVTFNRANVSLWWSFFNHITYILTQPRQTGKSFNADLLSTGLQNFWTQNTQINLLTATDKLRQENIERLKKIYETLPGYLNFKDRTDTNNTQMLTINKYNNRYITHVAQSSEQAAHKAARGLTTPIIQIDEGPFQSNIETSTQAAFGAMGAAIAAAVRNNSPYGILWTTTAGNQDDINGKFVYSYVCGAALWSDLFYDAVNEEELRKIVKTHSRSKDYRVYGAFNHRQLGKSDEWLADQLLRTGSVGDKANADYFNIWPSGSASSVIPKETLRMIREGIVEPLHTSVSEVSGYLVRWYIPENQIESYMANNSTVAGIDTSDGVGEDALSFVLTDARSGKLIAANTVNLDNLINYAEWVSWMLIKYSNITAVIERRNQATTIIDYIILKLLSKGIDPFKRLFNWVVNDPLEYKTLYDEVKLPLHQRSQDLYTRAKVYFGFATSGSGRTSRTMIYSTVLLNSAKRFGKLICDSETAGQILSLVERNGRIDHPAGGHDDLVIGWLMGHWLLSRGSNLKFYGIDSSITLQDMDSLKKSMLPQTFNDQIQQRIRTRISELVELMSSEAIESIYARYEQEIKHLDKQLVLGDNEFFSLDKAMDHVRQEREKSKPVSQAPVISMAQRYGYAQSEGYYM